MYTFDIETLQRMLTEINKSGTIAKTRILLEIDSVKHLKAFRIISSEMPTSLILYGLYFSCLCIRIFLLIFI